MRRVRAVMSVVMMVVALVGVGAWTASTATAAPVPASVVPTLGPDCKGDPPVPASPYGNLAVRPALISDRDPFTTAGVSLRSTYGTNYRWWWYDTGCNAGSDVMPSLATNAGNVLGLELPGLALAVGQGLFDAVVDPSGWIGAFDRPVEQASQAAAAGVWFPYLGLALLLVAVIVLARASRGALASTVSALAWAMLVLTVVTWTVGYPSESVKLLDSGVQSAVVTTASGFSPSGSFVGPVNPDRAAGVGSEADSGQEALAAIDGQWDTIVRSTAFRSWLIGVFGSADSATAKRFGPGVFKATHFTWTEYDAYLQDPTRAGKQIMDRKAGEFRTLAEQLHAADPVAYGFFTGNRESDRLGTAVLSLLSVALVVTFFLVAGLLVVLGYAVIRLLVPATPAAGVFFLFDAWREVALAWMQRIVKFIVMGPLAFLASLLLFRFDAAILAAQLPDPIKLAFVAALSWLAWRLLRPHAAIGRMPGRKLIRQVVATRIGLPHVGARGSKGHHDEATGSSAEHPEQAPSRHPVASGSAIFAEGGGPWEQDWAPSDREFYRSTRWRHTEASVSNPVPAAPGRVARSVSGTFAPRTTPTTVADDLTEARVWRVRSETQLRDQAPLVVDRPPPAAGALGRAAATPVPRRSEAVPGELFDGPLPPGVHESNLTVDQWGNAAFVVYSPQGSRRYVQE